MPAISGAAVVVFQQDELTRRDIHWAMIFLCLIALALIAQAVGVIVMSMFGAKLLHRVNGIADIVETKTGPIMDRTNLLLQELGPKVKNVGDNAEQISSTVRVKVEELGVTMSELNETMREINGRTRVQVKRADNIVSDALHATEEISNTVQQGIRGPVKQVAGVIAGVKAAMDTLVARSRFGRD